MERKFVAYYRVSTQKQGESGLGLEAQQETVRKYLNGGGALVTQFVEIESGRKTEAQRPQLKAALEACRKHGAVLILAKLDRLARNVHFVSGLMQSKVKFVACDMPEANELTIHIMAAFAEHEAKRISQRTRDALAVAKARGVVLGKEGAKNLRPNIEARIAASESFAAKLQPLFESMRARGLSQRAMVEELNSMGVPAPKGGEWGLSQWQRIMKLLAINRCATQHPQSD